MAASTMANNQLKFRVATLDDAEQVQQLVESAFRAEDSRTGMTLKMPILSQSFRQPLQEVIDIINSSEADYLIGCDGKDVPLVSIGVGRKPTMARFFMISVNPEHHGNGAGRQALAAAETYCIDKLDIKKAGLNAIWQREELIEWYIRRGYRKTGEKTDFPYDRFAGIDIPQDLYFVEMEKNLSGSPVEVAA